MDKLQKVMFTFGILVVLILGLYFFSDWFSKVTGYFTGEDEKINLGKCLAEKGSEFYGSQYCAECEKQREILGKGFNYIVYVDCLDEELSGCTNLKSVPAWYINKNIFYGLKNIEELKSISGCLSKQ